MAYLDQGVRQAPRVAVVGAGWAGLAAAVELSGNGVQVDVFEASRQLGGRARRIEADGQLLDNGQHILLGAYRSTLRLLNRVGVDVGRHLQRLPLDLAHPAADFRLRLPTLPAPLHLAAGLLAARGLSWSERLDAVRFMRALQADGYRLAQDCSVDGLLTRHRQGERLRRLLWDALCLAALNTPPKRASARIFVNVLRDSLGGQRADTDLLLPTDDLGQLFPDAAAAFIEQHGGNIRRATRIATVPTGRVLQGQQYDHLVLAVAPQHAAALLAENEPLAPVTALLHSYTYEPIATVYARYPARVPLPCPMLGLDDGSGQRLGQWVFARPRLGRASDAAAPAGTLLAFVLSASGTWDQSGNETLMERLHDELTATLRVAAPALVAPPSPEWFRVIRERRATFSCRPNLPRPSLRTAVPGIWLAGDYVCADYPATLEGAVRSGIAAAQAILASD